MTEMYTARVYDDRNLRTIRNIVSVERTEIAVNLYGKKDGEKGGHYIRASFPPHVSVILDKQKDDEVSTETTEEALRRLFPKRDVTPPYTMPHDPNITVTWNDGVNRDHFPPNINPTCLICNGRNPQKINCNPEGY